MSLVERVGRFLARMVIALVVLASIAYAGAYVGFRLGFPVGFQDGRVLDWQAVRIEREVTFRGWVRVLDLPPRTWAKACLLEAGDDRDEAPMPRQGEPPWRFDYSDVTLVLADAAGVSRGFRLRELRRARGTPKCVPVEESTKLVYGHGEGLAWAVHFE